MKSSLVKWNILGRRRGRLGVGENFLYRMERQSETTRSRRETPVLGGELERGKRAHRGERIDPKQAWKGHLNAMEVAEERRD